MTFEEWLISDDCDVDAYNNPYDSAKKAWDARQAEIDELQKRIDEALRELMVYKNIQTAVTALKGNQNEN